MSMSLPTSRKMGTVHVLGQVPVGKWLGATSRYLADPVLGNQAHRCLLHKAWGDVFVFHLLVFPPVYTEILFRISSICFPGRFFFFKENSLIFYLKGQPTERPICWFTTYVPVTAIAGPG